MITCITVHTTQTTIRACHTLPMISIEVTAYSTRWWAVGSSTTTIRNTSTIYLSISTHTLTQVIFPYWVRHGWTTITNSSCLHTITNTLETNFAVSRVTLTDIAHPLSIRNAQASGLADYLTTWTKVKFTTSTSATNTCYPCFTSWALDTCCTVGLLTWWAHTLEGIGIPHETTPTGCCWLTGTTRIVGPCWAVATLHRTFPVHPLCRRYAGLWQGNTLSIHILVVPLLAVTSGDTCLVHPLCTSWA